MPARNPHLARLPANYLFPEIQQRCLTYLAEHADASLVNLSIGNTTEPLTPHIAAGLARAVEEMTTRQGYSGYGGPKGHLPLREGIAQAHYRGCVDADEVFIGDGSKCDLGRLQVLFGPEATIAVQDPAYPVYVDSGVIVGMSGKEDESVGQFERIRYLACTPENDFFPDLDSGPRTDVLYFCSPNNPTGAVATRKQLERLVAYCQANRTLLVFDAAYASFIRDESLPRTIFEIEGARQVAIETNSLSKTAGFTGVRLGWTVVPRELAYDCGSPVQADWNRLTTTLFAGASNLVQRGAVAAFEPEGLAEMQTLVDHYMAGAERLAQMATDCQIEHYGGRNAPYVWLRFPGRSSWEVFEEILDGAHVIATPGVGFGKAGEGFVRLSAFASAEGIAQADERLRKLWA